MVPLPRVTQSLAGLGPRATPLVGIVAVRRRFGPIASAERDDGLRDATLDGERRQTEDGRRSPAARRRARHQAEVSNAQRRHEIDLGDLLDVVTDEAVDLGDAQARVVARGSDRLGRRRPGPPRPQARPPSAPFPWRRSSARPPPPPPTSPAGPYEVAGPTSVTNSAARRWKHQVPSSR